MLFFFKCWPVLHLYCSSSEPNVEVTLDKMFDELAFKQNDSKWSLKTYYSWYVLLLLYMFLHYFLFTNSNSTKSYDCPEQESPSEQSMRDHCGLYLWGTVW